MSDPHSPPQLWFVPAKGFSIRSAEELGLLFQEVLLSRLQACAVQPSPCMSFSAVGRAHGQPGFQSSGAILLVMKVQGLSECCNVVSLFFPNMSSTGPPEQALLGAYIAATKLWTLGA
jgi:hypothetical protein